MDILDLLMWFEIPHRLHFLSYLVNPTKQGVAASCPLVKSYWEGYTASETPSNPAG